MTRPKFSRQKGLKKDAQCPKEMERFCFQKFLAPEIYIHGHVEANFDVPFENFWANSRKFDAQCSKETGRIFNQKNTTFAKIFYPWTRTRKFWQLWRKYYVGEPRKFYSRTETDKRSGFFQRKSFYLKYLPGHLEYSFARGLNT